MAAARLEASAQTTTVAAPITPPHIGFDVVSVKPNRTDTSHPGSMIRGDGFDAENITPVWVLYWAFDCGIDRDEKVFSGLPAWVKSERFDIIAKVADADVPTWKKLPNSEKESMVLQVLEDRFKLTFHRESIEAPVYALVVAKGGPKMTEVDVPASDRTSGSAGWIGRSKEGVIGGHATMKTLTDYLNVNVQLGRRVLDKTALTGNYDFKFNYTPFPQGSFSDDAIDPSGSQYPYIFGALQEQLGLRLEPTRGLVDMIVIDHIERPSSN
ncbi:MAG: TIGR03435 family protein [Acidobacteriaceae bacterium]|jgi:uncharacterized protein (TIGR03435 family)